MEIMLPVEKGGERVEMRIIGTPDEIAAFVMELQTPQADLNNQVMDQIIAALEQKLHAGTPEA